MKLMDRLLLAWSILTTWTPESYEGQHPSTGQCGVTALLLHDLHGLPLIEGRAWEPGASAPVKHYWCDPTWAQFKPGTRLIAVRPITRERLCANEWMNERAWRLACKVEACRAS